jgi:squalene-hopene/tetraprenyl-beta-curcumene cyclase
MAVTVELTQLDAAIERGTQRLLELQRPDGIWVGELESNVTMTSQHLFWNHALGLRTPEMDERIANELLARMRDDGTWSIWFEGPPDLSTSLEAYVALRMCGVDPGPATLAYLQREGGIPKARLFTKCFLALLGQWPWQKMVPIPPELVLLPPRGPFSIYNFACWARQTFVALSLAQSLRPVRPIEVDLRMLGAIPGRTRASIRRDPLRRLAQRRAEQWIRARQEVDGSWGGIQPPWVWGIIALDALGYDPAHDDTMRRAVDGWQGFMVDDGDRLRPEACQSPVWDTALAVLALRACGVAADHPQLVAAGEYLLRQQVTLRGDWSIRAPDLSPGGWAFEFENDLYPDVDDAAVVALALHELGRGQDAIARGVDWLAGMQSRDGGWGAFDVDNQAMWLYKVPFCDFGKVTDEPSADVTAHSLEILGTLGIHRGSAERGLEWLLSEQEEDGSWFGRWGVNHIYGTGAALPGLEACGIPHDHPSMRRAVAWLDSVQQENGGFGEDIRSYGDPAWRGRADFTTPSQTAWALLGYVAAGNAEDSAARRAADYLCAVQGPDGDWHEEHFTGTGFPLDFMIRYHLYRITFPLLALGRLRERLAG